MGTCQIIYLIGSLVVVILILLSGIIGLHPGSRFRPLATDRFAGKKEET